ncbi:MAG: hypothetical protein HY096_01550 [Nitrospinae bacterium]|nr:hypothetical protein [Nitrospinota bacterium]
MEPSYIILTIIKHNNGKFIGKTLLQKTVFFLNELLRLGIPFKPHYYGPYSSEVAVAIENLVALGFLKEVEESFPVWDVWGEVRRYIYELTDEGEEILSDIKSHPQYNNILEQLNLIGTYSESKDYDKLSKAAKIYYIVKAKEKINRNGIKKEANKLGWSLEDKEINNLSSFLEELNLVKNVKRHSKTKF